MSLREILLFLFAMVLILAASIAEEENITVEDILYKESSQ